MDTNTSWVDKEFEQAFIRDDRLAKRLIDVTKKLAANPKATLPEALGGWKGTKGCYSMLDNENISPNVILSGHCLKTLERMKNYDEVLVIQDTTAVDFSHHPGTEGIGLYSQSKEKKGMLLHSALAVTPEGVALGLLYQKYWSRDGIDENRDHKLLPIEEKESYKWIECMDQSLENVPSGVKVITVCDREADIYELFQHGIATNRHMLLRASKNRRVMDENYTTLYSVMKNQDSAGEVIIQVPRNTRQKVPTRPAKVRIKFCPVLIRPPKNKPFTKGAPNLELYSVLVEEVSVPPKGVKPIHWLLLTDLPVESLEDALEMIKRYTQRWKIERFHYTLKSGCQIKDLQLGVAERLEKAVTIYSIIAWKILYMTYESRENPDISCEAVFKEHEWQALFCFVNHTSVPPVKPPSLFEAMMMVARLGGFLGRKSDGMPGVKVLWRGMSRLYDIAEMWSITHL